MEFIKYAAQFGIAWFVGNFIAGSITQIGCCIFCSFPLIKRIETFSNLFDIKTIKKLFRVTVILHSIILIASSVAVVLLAPKMCQYGFFFSFIFMTLIGCGKWGINDQNTIDFLQIVLKKTYAGKELEAAEVLKTIFG